MSRKNTVPLLNVVLSDLHCGSDVGLLPDHVELEDGTEIGHGKNPWQKWLWKTWLRAMERITAIVGRDPFILTLTGDLIEGIHHHSDEVVAAKIMEHLTIARAAVGPLVKKADVTHVVRGTECHTRDLESVFAKDFDAGKAHDFIQYRLNGTLIDARHHMPVTGRVHLEASALSILAANNRSNAVRAGHAPARVFLRGHRHVAGHYSDGEVLVCCTGAWQGLTRHGRKVVADSIPRPSIAVLDARKCEHGALPAIHHIVFNPPQALVAHVVA